MYSHSFKYTFQQAEELKAKLIVQDAVKALNDDAAKRKINSDRLTMPSGQTLQVCCSILYITICRI